MNKHTAYSATGLGVSPGIAIGPVYLYRRATTQVPAEEIAPEAVDHELKRFEQAVQRAERDLQKIANVAQEKIGADSAVIFEAQSLMLRDVALYGAVVDAIQEHRHTAAYAVKEVMGKHRKIMEASENAYFRERAHDLLDVQERLIRHLRREKLLSRIQEDAIVISETLTAADIVLFSRRGILGCATDFGGPTSHVSIMARALGVPAVFSMHGITDYVQPGDIAIVDGVAGRVILRPDEATLAQYQYRKTRYQQIVLEQRKLAHLPGKTTDGHHVTLKANLEFKEELELLPTYGAEGIGLFRTEMEFLLRGRLHIDEYAQYQTYRKVIEAVAPHPTTFRVIDLGGDKMLPMSHREQNPFLGWRGIRVLLDKQDELLVPQLRALLRASAHGPMRILVPMVSTVDEVLRFRAVYDRVCASLDEDDLPYDADTPLGIMIEVPSAALRARQLAQHVDFFSIGTNDLTQYTLAVDRGNDLVAMLYDSLHPAVLSLIDQTVQAAKDAGISVSVCGEFAADPRGTILLTGIGVDELSVSPTYLPEVKQVIRAMSLDEAQAIARAALDAGRPSEVKALLERWLSEHALDLKHLLELRPGLAAAETTP
ncbi:MAG: phosphoenolpyruvate--protein phosphotransferase [Bacteroidota bacterium]